MEGSVVLDEDRIRNIVRRRSWKFFKLNVLILYATLILSSMMYYVDDAIEYVVINLNIHVNCVLFAFAVFFGILLYTLLNHICKHYRSREILETGDSGDTPGPSNDSTSGLNDDPTTRSSSNLTSGSSLDPKQNLDDDSNPDPRDDPPADLSHNPITDSTTAISDDPIVQSDSSSDASGNLILDSSDTQTQDTNTNSGTDSNIDSLNPNVKPTLDTNIDSKLDSRDTKTGSSNGSASDHRNNPPDPGNESISNSERKIQKETFSATQTSDYGSRASDQIKIKSTECK